MRNNSRVENMPLITSIFFSFPKSLIQVIKLKEKLWSSNFPIKQVNFFLSSLTSYFKVIFNPNRHINFCLFSVLLMKLSSRLMIGQVQDNFFVISYFTCIKILWDWGSLKMGLKSGKVCPNLSFTFSINCYTLILLHTVNLVP